MKISLCRRQIAVCLGSLVLSLPGVAAEPLPTASGLANALEQAWRLHPQAASLDARDAEANAAREVAARLTPEPGSVSIGSLNDRLNRNLGRQEWEVELATPLWLPGQKAARVAEAASRIDEAVAKRAALRLELAGEVREAWWALAIARNAKSLVVQRRDTARALSTNVRRLFEAGEVSRIDANLAQNELHVADAEMIETDLSLLQAEQVLRTLTGAPAPTDLTAEKAVERSTMQPLVGGVTIVPESHPLLVVAAATSRSARAKVKVAVESRRAAPELALRVVRERGDFAEPYANSVGITLKIPFSSAAQVRRETSSAQAEADQADAELARVQTRVQLVAVRAERALQATERQLAMAAERHALAAENLLLTERAFSLGESDLATLLRVRAAAYDAEAFFSRQRVARAAAQSQLNQSLGVLP